MATVPVIAEVPGPVKVKIPFAATVIKAGDRYLIQVPARPGQIYCLEVPDGSGGMTFAGVPGSAVYAQSDTVGWPLELTGTVVGAKEDGNSAGASAGASPPAAGGTVLLPLTIEVSESLGTHVRLLVGGASPWVAVAEVAFPRVTFEGFADLPTATGVRCTALSTRVVTAPIGATEPGKAALTLEQQQEFDAILAGLPQLIAAATLPPGATPALGTGGTSPLAASRYFRVAMYVVDSNGNGFADADELAGGMKPFARPGEPGYVNATDAGGNGGSGISPIWDRDEDFSPDFEEIAAGTSLSEKRYAPVVLTCQTFDRRADFDSAGSWRELEQRVVGWERHWDGFNEEMLSWSPPSLLVRTTPRTLSGFMSDFADGWENPDPESGKGLPPRSLFEEYFMLPALIARRVRPAAGVAGNPEATSGYIRAIGARYRLRGPLSSEDQHRQFLKVTWTQTTGFDENQSVEYAAWSLMGQPLLEQAPTSVEVVTLTIPRGSLYSDPPHDVVPQYSVPNGPANPEMLHSQVGEYLKVVRLLPLEIEEVYERDQKWNKVPNPKNPPAYSNSIGILADLIRFNLFVATEPSSGKVELTVKIVGGGGGSGVKLLCGVRDTSLSSSGPILTECAPIDSSGFAQLDFTPTGSVHDQAYRVVIGLDKNSDGKLSADEVVTDTAKTARGFIIRAVRQADYQASLDVLDYWDNAFFYPIAQDFVRYFDGNATTIDEATLMSALSVQITETSNPTHIAGSIYSATSGETLIPRFKLPEGSSASNKIEETMNRDDSVGLRAVVQNVWCANVNALAAPFIADASLQTSTSSSLTIPRGTSISFYEASRTDLKMAYGGANIRGTVSFGLKRHPSDPLKVILNSITLDGVVDDMYDFDWTRPRNWPSREGATVQIGYEPPDRKGGKIFATETEVQRRYENDDAIGKFNASWVIGLPNLNPGAPITPPGPTQ